jgi:UDP-3-O-[3-hydroxymyristoyl] glucosamine N-acyltransferase
MKEISISDLAKTLHGKVMGNISSVTSITGTCPIDNYVIGKLTFVRGEKYAQMLSALKGAVVLIPETFSHLTERYPQNMYIAVKDVAKAMIEIQRYFNVNAGNISPIKSYRDYNSEDLPLYEGRYIYENVYLGKGISIGAGTIVMPNSILFDNVKIGENTIIEPGVTIYRDCEIGNECLISSGACIGTDGFRFEHDVEHHTIQKMIHKGHVIVGNRVEIGCNTTICRSTFNEKPTIISDEVKLGNQVDIAHNVFIGARTSIAPQTCISGSARIGEDVWIGTGVSVSNGVNVGNGAKILLNAVVAYDVPDREMVSGFYAIPHKQWKIVWNELLKMIAKK